MLIRNNMRLLLSFGLPLATAFLLPCQTPPRTDHVTLFAATIEDTAKSDVNPSPKQGFDLDTALFAAGLAFDSYVEPAQNSSRWERGSKGMNVAFLSNAFTRNLYKGLVEVTPISVSGLPDDDDGVEKLISGGGVDACILVAAIEGQWKEDVDLLKQEYHEGIMDLTGAAHIGRSTTAWANVNENKSNASKKKTGKALPYHVPKGWGRDASAVWPEPDPFFIYVQDPANVMLLFTVFDDDVVGEGSAIGSTYAPLRKVLPQVQYSQDDIISKIKNEIVSKIQKGELDPDKIDDEVDKAVKADTQAWEGNLKLTSKPRIKDKKGQVALAMAAGAIVAGPMGAAVGGALGNMYEGTVKGRIFLRLRYLPIPNVSIERKKYTVYGGMPGINWGDLYNQYLSSKIEIDDEKQETLTVAGNDLEHVFFINHDVTGGCCAVYRSLEKKLIVVSFRGTCKPVDILTDASIVQEPWVEGEDPNDPEVAKVHVGFRRSMNSIARRLKELILAVTAPGDSISGYDVLVTGHSLGGALATLFAADIGEFGIDAGRALPQTDASDDWWKALSNTFLGNQGTKGPPKTPPRPKSIRLYNFGSPRVGNKKFAARFQQCLDDGKINQAYRLVNNQDVVARAPRSMGGLSIDYGHCGSTVLVGENVKSLDEKSEVLWVEGESDDRDCPVRDYEMKMSSPTAEGTLLGDLLNISKEDSENIEEQKVFDKLGQVASKVSKRLSTMSVSDMTTVLGIDKSFTERELKMVNALMKGDALAHHLEDSYYTAMGIAGGFVAMLDEEIVPLTSETRKLLVQTKEGDDENNAKEYQA